VSRDIVRLAWVAVRLGEGNKVEKRLQSVVFLLQALGFPTSYNFDQHIGGPYSSNLAEDYEEMVKEGLLHEYAKYTDVDEERWGPIVDKLAAEDVLVLKVAATLYDLLDAGWSLEEAKERVMELKPYATERLLEAGVRLLRELGLVREKPNLNGA